MEKRNNLLLALVALIALAVGVFAGMNLQGGGLQGKLALTKDASKKCEEVKEMYYIGTLTKNLGSEKAASDRVKYCANNYPAFWNAVPTIKECIGLKLRLDIDGPKAFSAYLKKVGISDANTTYCTYTFPFLFYGNTLTANECWYYKSMFDQKNLTKSLNNNSKMAGDIQKICFKKAIGWGPVINVDQSTCEAYKVYLKQDTLSDMIANGEADAQIAFSCSTTFSNLWWY